MAEPTNTSQILQGNPFKPLASTVSGTFAAAPDDAGTDAASHGEGGAVETSDVANNPPTAVPSIAEAAASAEVEGDDVESQRRPSDDNDDGEGDYPSPLEKPLPNAVNASMASAPNVGIFAYDEDDTASVFSFDSFEKGTHIPLNVQNMIRRQQEEGNGMDGSSVPFPSVVGQSLEYEGGANVCPCRCLFFTLKETIFLIMSALGCAVFLTGLVLLCMYLAGSAFNNG